MSSKQEVLPIPNKVYRMTWTIVWTICCRWLPRSLGNSWKCFILRCFGAKIQKGAMVYSSAKIYCPYNLTMKKGARMDMGVNCYNVAMVTMEENSTVSQGASLFPGSHDISNPLSPMVGSPILLCRGSWVAAQAFVGVGVKIGEGAVVGARAAVFKDVEPWTVVGGNPAKIIKKRVLCDTQR